METVSVQPHLPFVYNVRGSNNSNSNSNNYPNTKSSLDVNNSKNTLTLSSDLANSSSSRERGRPMSKICTIYDVNNSSNNKCNNNNNTMNYSYNNDNGMDEMFESVEVCHRGRRRLMCAAESSEDVFDIYYTLPDGTPLSYRSTVCMDQHILARIRDDLRRVAKKLDNPESAMPERGPIFIEDIARAVTENDQLRYTVEPELIESVCLPVLNGHYNINYSSNNTNNNVNASNVTVTEAINNMYNNNNNNNNNSSNINNSSNDKAIPRSSTSPDTAVKHRKRLHKNKNGNSNSSSLPNRSLSPATSVANTSRSSQANLSRKSSKVARNSNGVHISSMSSGVPYGLSNFVTTTNTLKDVVNENPSKASLERSLTNGLSLSNENNQKVNNSKETAALKSEYKHKNAKTYKRQELDDIDEFIRQEQARSREFATAV